MSYVPLRDVILTGDARAITPLPGDNDVSIATTEFISNALENYLPLSGGTLTGQVILDPGADLTLDAGSAINLGAVSLTQYDPNTLKTDQDFAAGNNIIAMQGLDEEVVIGNAGPGGLAAGMTFGIDTNLYRFDSNILKTDDDLIVSGALTVESPTLLDDTLTVEAKTTLAAGLNVKAQLCSGNVSVDLDADHVYLVDVSLGASTVTLPAVHSLGDTIIVKDHKGNCTSHNITIESSVGDLIDGLADFTMIVPYQAITLISDGTNWALI